MNYICKLTLYFLIIICCLSFKSYGVDFEKSSKKAAQALFEESGATGNKITENQLMQYFAKKRFKIFDKNEDGSLSFLEYSAAYLNCDKKQRPVVTTEPIKCYQEQEKADLFKELHRSCSEYPCQKLDLSLLLSTHYLFQKLVSSSVQNFSGGKSEMSLKEVEEVLKNQLKMSTTKAQIDRLKILFSESDTLNVGVAKWRFDAWFNNLDINKSDSIDFFEFLSALSYPEAVLDYVKFTNSNTKSLETGLISRKDFVSGNCDDVQCRRISGPHLSLNTNFFTIFETIKADTLIDTSGITSQAKVEDTVEKELDRLDKEIREKQKSPTLNLGPFEVKYIENLGVIIGTEVLNDPITKENVPNYDKDFTTLRLIKDFLKSDDNAETADISWAKKAGNSPIANIDLTVRFDYHNSDWWKQENLLTSVAYGFSYKRSGEGDDKVKLKEYFILANIDVNHSREFLLKSNFQLGPKYSVNEVKKVEKLTTQLHWEPILRFPNFTTSVKTPTKNSNDVKWYIRPRMFLEYEDIRKQPDLQEGDDTMELLKDKGFIGYSMEFGLNIMDNTNFIYTFTKRHTIGEFKSDYTFHSAAVEIQFGPLENYVVKISYNEGEDTPDFDSVENMSLGLGVKF